MIIGPTIWEETLGFPKGSALIQYKYPTIFSMTLGFVAIWFFSITDKSARAQVDKDAFEAQNIRCQTGIGAEGAVSH
jgi:cation/acetate symporter